MKLRPWTATSWIATFSIAACWIAALTLIISGSASSPIETEAFAQSAGAPIRPGIRQADQAEAQTDKNIPPPAEQPLHIDLAKVSAEADELARIAQTIPADVASVRGGMLPKDILQKLKQIEKLSRHLRSQLEH